MKLNDCTKPELIRVIELLKANFVTNGDYYLARALGKIADQRANEYLNESERLGKEADKMRRRYMDVLQPYRGVPLSDIPSNVLMAARSYLRRAIELDRKSTEASKRIDALWEE